MPSYKEIVTKTVVGKGKKFFKDTYTIEVEGPSNVLGCWVINHKFKGYKAGEKIGVDGQFDVNIWYSYEGDSKTAVINKKIEYSDSFSVAVRESTNLTEDPDVLVRSLKQPSVTDVKVEDNIITFTVEKELGVEMVGEAMVKISVEDEEDPWDEIIDEKELDKVQDDFLEESL